jgi:hypothetical protein
MIQVRAQHLVAHSTRLGRVDRQLRKQRNLSPPTARAKPTRSGTAATGNSAA